MKKICALALSALMIVSMAVSVSAAWQDNDTDVSLIKYTIPQAYAEHKLDGVISEGEYSEVPFTTKELSFAAYDEASIEASAGNDISLWMSYDDKYVYVAATTIAKGHICECDDNPGNIWGAYAIQLSMTDIDNDDAGMRLETGYALSSESGDLLAYTWSDGMGIGYDALASKDFMVVNDGTTITYEMRVPYEAFSEKKLAEGDQFRFCIVWATGTSAAGGADQYIHEQLAYGCTGDPGKDVTGHATITLGAALEAPVVDVPAEDAGTAAPVTPPTADAGILAAAAVMAVAAGVVLSRKH